MSPPDTHDIVSLLTALSSSPIFTSLHFYTSLKPPLYAHFPNRLHKTEHEIQEHLFYVPIYHKGALLYSA